MTISTNLLYIISTHIWKEGMGTTCCGVVWSHDTTQSTWLYRQVLLHCMLMQLELTAKFVRQQAMGECTKCILIAASHLVGVGERTTVHCLKPNSDQAAYFILTPSHLSETHLQWSTYSQDTKFGNDSAKYNVPQTFQLKFKLEVACKRRKTVEAVILVPLWGSHCDKCITTACIYIHIHHLSATLTGTCTNHPIQLATTYILRKVILNAQFF